MNELNKKQKALIIASLHGDIKEIKNVKENYYLLKDDEKVLSISELNELFEERKEIINQLGYELKDLE